MYILLARMQEICVPYLESKAGEVELFQRGYRSTWFDTHIVIFTYEILAEVEIVVILCFISIA